ncbi:hypothetical protein CONLIGDRAFT_204312 [Coniochaeta ligniaria NRRL 30616]|uniref:Uncharacterized protein n=1 Tax=Coniochaeta ligniaria NRRL 30616 TaxID=1408157 RepID=A0A1J7J3F0_9PEZI|nr:hypothetical protein CONLIGDRAFT_204312 [Coniochaeta ligniaria NRRL 30616]
MSRTSEAMRESTLILYYKLAPPEKATRSEEALRISGLIVSHLRDIPVGSSTAASHTWPLYMAGSVLTGGPEADPAIVERRKFIRNRLVAIRSERGIRSIDAVRTRLEEIWMAPLEVGVGGMMEEGPVPPALVDTRNLCRARLVDPVLIRQACAK